MQSLRNFIFEGDICLKTKNIGYWGFLLPVVCMCKSSSLYQKPDTISIPQSKILVFDKDIVNDTDKCNVVKCDIEEILCCLKILEMK